jgi:oligopeptide transport system ATP-binding protein
MITVKDLKKHFKTKEGVLKAVDGVSFTIQEGETLGLVGESGCGKSTLGRLLLRLQEATSGEVFVGEKNLFDLSSKELKEFRKTAQMIFQDPYASLNPRMTVEDIVREPFEIHNIDVSETAIYHLLQKVHLDPVYRRRFPHEFSGGQRQRIGIARALALNPKFIVCDEPISALDVSTQSQIVALLKNLQADLNLTYLFISHDLRMVKYIATRVAVMYLGHLVEIAPGLFENPLHPYTQALLSAIPVPDPQMAKKRTRIILKGEMPSPLTPPKGCAFCTRCPKVMEKCSRVAPSLKEVTSGHFVACHLYE